MIEPGVALSTLAYSGTAGLGMSIGFLVVRWGAHFIAGRIDKKEDRLDAGMTALLAGLREELDRVKKDCSEFRDALRKCEDKHAESAAEVMQLKAMLQGYGDARQIAQLQVAADKQAGKE
jgi:hypothetical protein